MSALLRRVLILLGAALLSGCYAVQEHRARQFQSSWDQLEPSEQERLRAATIALGDSPKAVYFALGTPNYAFRQGFEETVWVYWGIRLEELSDATPPTLHFISRGELRLPHRGDERLELRITFEDQRARAWTLGPIDLAAAANYRPLPMGAFPTAP